ncbi:MAG: PQQ-binding-like beta-propeller repeat protein, partial [Planctomycetota bacterium]
MVGTYGYGHNLFCLNPDGTLAWKTFLPEHSVFFTKWIDDGKRLVAATGRGYSVFLLDGKTGKVLRKFASTEWPRTHWKEGSVHTVVPIMINRAQRQILVRGRTGLLAVDFDGKKMWLLDRTEAIQSIPAEADPGVSAPIFQASVVLGNLAVSPDGKRIAFGEYYISGTTPGQKPGSFEQVWSYRPRILDAVTGAVLAENTEDPGAMTSPEGWSVSWPDGNEHPLVHKEDVAAPLLPDGSFGAFRAIRGGLLPDGGELLRETTTVVRKRPDGSVAWQRTEPLIRVLSLDRIDARAERLFRCGRDGEIACVDLSNGETLWTAKLPFSAQIRVAPDGRVFAGDLAGHVASFAPDGTEAWRVRLREFHELPAGDYPGYVDAARRRDRDDTPDYYPAGVDRPGDYDGILRMGIEQIADGSFEGKGAWSSESADVVRGAPAREGKQALQLAADQLVTQALGKRVVPNGTYLLEFFYRPASAAAELAAGASLDGPTPAFTASMFRGRPGEWNFGRLAIKAYTDTERLTVGFEAAGDAVAVDAVSLRPVRFPSANLLYYEPLHKLEPTYVEDLRVTYNRIPAKMEEGLMGKNRVSAFKQGENMTATVFTQEDAYLHNGRLDDVGRQWTFGCGNAMGFSVTLTKTAWISHLVLYLNNSTPEMHYRTISIWANNIETRIPEAVAVVRGNSRRFIVVHFPEPIHTDALSILPFQEYKQFRDSLTEVEVYGPLGGPEMGRNKRYSDDPKGWPMLMGGPAHVPSQWPADLVGRYRQVGAMRAGYPALQCGATVTDGVFTWGQADGVVRSLRWPDPEDRHHRYRWGPTWSLGSITPTTTPTRYAGRLLVGSADNKLHAVADNGQHLWSFPTGGRVLSAPVARGDDVYFGSDDGSLYRADVDSGILLWEYEAGGRVHLHS